MGIKYGKGSVGHDLIGKTETFAKRLASYPRKSTNRRVINKIMVKKVF